MESCRTNLWGIAVHELLAEFSFIQIYGFGRRLYPNRLVLHWSYKFFQFIHYQGIEPMSYSLSYRNLYATYFQATFGMSDKIYIYIYFLK